MALERYGQPTDGMAEGIRSIGNVFAQLPRIRAQAGLLGAQTAKETAQAGEAAQHGELFRQLGLKSADEMAAAQEVAGALQNLQKNPDGSVTIPADSIGKISSIIARTGNPNSTGGGIKNIFSTANAPVEANANRQNKIDVAQARPLVMKPGESAVSLQPAVQGVDPESGDPVTTGGVGNIVAALPPSLAQSQVNVPQGSTLVDRATGQPIIQAPANLTAGSSRTSAAVGTNAPAVTVTAPVPVGASKDYRTESVRDVKNPAYDIANGATNVPSVIKMTNITHRASGPATAQSQSQPAQNNNGQFDSEQSARAAGHGAGSIIYIKGVGKVRLK